MKFYIARDYNGQLWVFLSKPKVEGWCWHCFGGMMLQLKQNLYPKVLWTSQPLVIDKDASEIEKLIEEKKQHPKIEIKPPLTVKEYNKLFEQKLVNDKKRKELTIKIFIEFKKIFENELDCKYTSVESVKTQVHKRS